MKKKKEKKEEKDVSYWLPIGMCLGISIGSAIGYKTHNTPIWIAMGISLGLCIGVAFSNKNNKK